MKTITTPTGIELILVSVPEDAEYFEVLEVIKKEVKNIKNFPRQGWNILGSVLRNTIDFDCSELVELSEEAKEVLEAGRPQGWAHNYSGRESGWEKYSRIKRFIESDFRSLLQSNGVIDYERLVIIQKIKM